MSLAHTEIIFNLSKRLLEATKDENVVRSQDLFTVVRYVSYNPLGQSMAWEWTTLNWDYLVNRLVQQSVNYVWHKDVVNTIAKTLHRQLYQKCGWHGFTYWQNWLDSNSHCFKSHVLSTGQSRQILSTNIHLIQLSLPIGRTFVHSVTKFYNLLLRKQTWQ